MKPIPIRSRAASFAAVAALTAPAFAVTVPGTADPWLAGMPSGTTASVEDVAPGQSPIQVTSVDVTLGGTLFFGVSGGVFNGPSGTFDPIDGGAVFSHSVGAEHGIADAMIPINALVGVFLDDAQPDGSPAPDALDFSPTGIGTAFATLAPLQKQVFFIGDGLTGSGTGSPQAFRIPAGATRLFLGTMDGFGWWNNVGSFDVTIEHVPAIPEPETLALLTLGFAAIAWRRRPATSVSH